MNQTGAPTGTALLKVTEAAEELRISRATMYRLINDGALPVVHIGAGRGRGRGRATRITRDALNAYIAFCALAGATPDVERSA